MLPLSAILELDKQALLALNFDGGVLMDNLMWMASSKTVWVPLYLLLIYLLLRRYGWKKTLLALVIIALTIVLADQICNLFKNNLPKFRPSHNPELEGLVHIVRGYRGGKYGTVSAHAATMVSMAVLAIGTIGRRWFTWLMVASVVVICYSRIYMAYHFPVDIALGAMVGLVSGGSMMALYRALERRRKRITN